ncbi:MAG: TIGR03619 family F420-dependent LLM class oxidoreductase [Candidatus Dadabacteria bacterium]|nr:MAG: TIGR03619 family F420-dependent LLM class oxidoreductase [Candidatus Dadabacteria bacterium]
MPGITQTQRTLVRPLAARRPGRTGGLTMRIGIALPQVGSGIGRNEVLTAARAAEAAAFDSVWVVDRICYPEQPRAPYPASPDGRLPESCTRVLDPLSLLTFAAAATERIRLGTSVLVLPWYPPLLLARQLATIDQLSGGRLALGFGTGWSPDEYEAVGVPFRERGRRADAAQAFLEAWFAGDSFSWDDEFWTVAPVRNELRPHQQPRPPIYWAAFAPRTLDRVARLGDGWMPAGLPAAVTKTIFAQIRERAANYGRDPEALELVIRANVLPTRRPVDKPGRMPFVGSHEQIAEDLQAFADIGTDELILESHGFFAGGKDVATAIEALAELCRSTGLSAR